LPGVVTGVWRRFGVHVFEGKLTVADMERLDESGIGWSRTNPGKRVELVIIFPSDAKMTGEERARMARIIKRGEHMRTASATVVLATGLVGAMHRSVLTGMQMVVPPPHPVKVFGATPDGVAWLTPYVQELCGDISYEDLLSGVDQLCAEFKARRQAPS
jgi:hypothetical protein